VASNWRTRFCEERDPDFAQKVAYVLDLHSRFFDVVALGPNGCVIWAIEKS
jgi:hypothetical protein